MTDLERTILDALRRSERFQRNLAIDLGMSPTRFGQHVLALLQNPEAEAADPLTVRRWRRIMAQRRDARRLSLQRV